MRTWVALLLLLPALPAAADLTVIEETETMTVYREGDQVIVLTDTERPQRDVFELAMSRAPDVAFPNQIRDKASRGAGTKFYLARTRLLVLLCY